MYNSTSMGEILLSKTTYGNSTVARHFQEKMSGLMGYLEFVRTHPDDLLILTKSSFVEHIQKLDEVLNRLKQAG